MKVTKNKSPKAHKKKLTTQELKTVVGGPQIRLKP